MVIVCIHVTILNNDRLIVSIGEHDALIHVRILERKVSSLPKDYLPQMEL